MPIKNRENVFYSLGASDQFALMVFIDLSLEAENESVNERIHVLIAEARKLLGGHGYNADVLFEQWKNQEEQDVTD